jgi:type IV pilus assembly protein PilO
MASRVAFLDSLSLAPPWQKLVIGVAALVAFGAAGYFIGVLPVSRRVDALRSQRETQEAEIATLRPMTAEVMRVRRETAEIERRLDVAKDKLPTEREIPTFYRTLSDAAVQAGLSVALFQPQAARARDFYTEIPVSLVAEGGYHEFGDFLARVAALPRVTMVSDLKLTAAKAPGGAPAGAAATGGLRAPAPATAAPRPPASITENARPRRSTHAEMTLVTYMYRPLGSPPAPKPPTAGGRPEPAPPEATKPEAAKP